ncbi:MAG TPA: hypothetical protein VFU05_18815 [Cyclobacteriaceae bacterium]|nr:hypothetical protein [Cyclobacteriaceae bacterium]
MASITIKILFFEAILGFLQVLYRVIFISRNFDGGTGDSAMGTVNLSFGIGDGLASNVYFAIGLSALGVLAIASRLFENRKVTTWSFLMIMFTWILASVMHSIFLMMAAIFITSGILVFLMPKNKLSFFKKQLNAIRSIMGIFIVVTIFLLLILPSNLTLIQSYYEKTFDPEKMRSTKSIATLATVRELSEDKVYQPFIGLGPGQYTSRASLILSGEYITSGIPDFLHSVSPDLDRYILPLWRGYKSDTFQAGSTYFPFYSWLSVYGEWGLLGFVILGLFLTRHILKMISNVNQVNFYLIIGVLIIIFYIFLLGVQDNYWEWGQFILPILIYAKTLYYLIFKAEPVVETSQQSDNNQSVE